MKIKKKISIITSLALISVFSINSFNVLATGEEQILYQEKELELAEKNNEYERMILEERAAKDFCIESGNYLRKFQEINSIGTEENSGNYGYGEKDYIHSRGTLNVKDDIAFCVNPEFDFSLLEILNLPKAQWHRYAKAAPLFRHKPHVNDIKQFVAKNCYFCAALMSILNMENGANIILNSMCDNGDGTVTVRFFDKDKQVFFVKVEKSTLKTEINGTDWKILNNSEHVIWPEILYKAYTIAVSKNKFSHEPKIKSFKTTFENSENGVSADVFMSLGFSDYGLVETEYLRGDDEGVRYADTKMELFNELKKSLDEKVPMTATRITGTHHILAVMEAKEINGIKFIGVLDPYNQQEEDQGFIYYEFNDFLKNFDQIIIAGEVPRILYDYREFLIRKILINYLLDSDLNEFCLKNYGVSFIDCKDNPDIINILNEKFLAENYPGDSVVKKVLNNIHALNFLIKE